MQITPPQKTFASHLPKYSVLALTPPPAAHGIASRSLGTCEGVCCMRQWLEMTTNDSQWWFGELDAASQQHKYATTSIEDMIHLARHGPVTCVQHRHQETA